MILFLSLHLPCRLIRAHSSDMYLPDMQLSYRFFMLRSARL